MTKFRAVEISLTCLFLAAAAALVLRRFPFTPRRPWVPTSQAAECSPAWRYTADQHPAGNDTFEQCLARHGKTLDSGYSLQ